MNKLTYSFAFVVFYTISANGKSIGEVRDFEELKVQERPNGADAFSWNEITKKCGK